MGAKTAKKERPTSWQRRKSRTSGAPLARRPAVAELIALNLECKRMKDESHSARERFRLKQPAEAGDADIVLAYQRVRDSASSCQQAYKATLQPKPKRKSKVGSLSAPDAAPTSPARATVPPGTSATFVATVAVPSPPASSVAVAIGEAVAGPMTAAALGVTPSERRLAKKAAKRAAVRERKAQKARMKGRRGT
uniref:Uncharacterized protein n=1 Tax=Coccolithus braarudii TaxID=221442 RepID=A0A7S0PZ84_9EUKA|mmetsp:Transcript_15978/g.34690  ORF Transcript_15978/g.34690 Transcript_15978/m.34690 type:complete len:194 (+) Transcript_15978:11-592(+)